MVINNARVRAVLGDITREKVEAIVNAANSGLMGGGGVDGAIHRAGGPAILDDCRRIVSKIGRLGAGKAVITVAGNLPAKHVIHTVGPIWHGGSKQEADTLASCYSECLKLASAHEIKSIAFPAVSTGVYGYPADLAARIAVNVVSDFLNKEEHSIGEVRFVLYDKSSYNIYLNELDSIS